MELTDEEKELVEDYRNLTTECKSCIALFMASAVQASQTSGTVIDFLSYLATNY